MPARCSSRCAWCFEANDACGTDDHAASGAYGTSLFIHASGTPPLSNVTTIVKNNTLGPGGTSIPVPAFGPFPLIPTNVGVRGLRTIDYHLQQSRLL